MPWADFAGDPLIQVATERNWLPEPVEGPSREPERPTRRGARTSSCLGNSGPNDLQKRSE